MTQVIDGNSMALKGKGIYLIVGPSLEMNWWGKWGGHIHGIVKNLFESSKQSINSSLGRAQGKITHLVL